MLVAHLFIETSSQPILLGDGGADRDCPPFFDLEALILSGISADEALSILSARRSAGQPMSQDFLARWTPADQGPGGATLYAADRESLGPVGR